MRARGVRVAARLALLAGICAGACGGAPAKHPTPPAAEAPVATPGPAEAPEQADGERGRASYYSDRLAGRPTASGEPYDPRAMTAAHRTLPFGTLVDVIRPDGQRVRVRVNDRGPHVRGRIIDLSRRAAEAIGMVRAGVVDVTVVVVEMPARAGR